MRSAIVLASCFLVAHAVAPAQDAGAQTAGARMEFEAASVKVAPAPEGPMRSRCTGGPGTSAPGSLTCENYSLSYLVMMAYNLRPFQFSGPGWMDSARYNVAAKIPAGTTLPQFRLMLQNLLADRFKLTCRSEKKEMAVYELSVAKNGPKMRPAVAEPASPNEPLWRQPLSPPGRTMVSRRAEKESMAALASFLSVQLDHPVTDATGLTGVYDFELRWMIDPAGRGPVASPPAEGAPGNLPEGDFGPTLVEAVRDQLGLALTQKKGPAEVLVVDRAEKVPIEN